MDLLKRIVVGVIFVPLLLYLYYEGGLWLLGFFSLLTALSTYEMFKMSSINNNLLLCLNILIAVLLFCQIALDLSHIILLLLCILLINGGIDVLFGHTDGFIKRVSTSLFAIVYPAIGFGLTYRLTEPFFALTYAISQPHYVSLLPILAICIWMTDTCAYFVGKTLGRHKGIFKCSPNKTLEGFIAGLLAPLGCSAILCNVAPEIYTWWHIVAIGVSAGLFGQFGDLFESMIKRDMGVKDSSHIIPGHGGVLDRFDSLLIAGPVLYLMMLFIV